MSKQLYPLTRRQFLRNSAGGIGLLAFSGFAPAFITRSVAAQAPAAGRDQRILVLVQLAGGNDGLNTVVPHLDDRYYNLRPNIAIPAKDVLRLNDSTALHPSMGEMAELWKNGKLSVVQNVGYPNPNRSHFRSTEIWETAVDSDRAAHTGWIGRYLDAECAGQPAPVDPNAIHIGDEMPQAVQSNDPHNIFGLPTYGRYRRRSGSDIALLEDVLDAPMGEDNAGYLQHTLMDALVTEKRVEKILNGYKPQAQYEGNSLAQSLQRVAGLIASGMETRVYFVKLGGFDTHNNQQYTHANLLGQLSRGLNAFQTDLEKHGLQDQVLTMTFSEFGRRPSQNQSNGTDHGTAAPLFVMGSAVNDTIVGQSPDLAVEQNKDLVYSTDFRQVYSTVLDKWFQVDTTHVIDKPFPPLSFI